jgi:hypothetical protein
MWVNTLFCTVWTAVPLDRSEFHFRPRVFLSRSTAEPIGLCVRQIGI